jgi:intracellular sulfur oxidation DsrE/DsrF family protein
MAMTVYSNVVAMQTGGKAEDILKDWTANVLPGVQVVPSGVWALGRAQEKQCAYIFAG